MRWHDHDTSGWLLMAAGVVGFWIVLITCVLSVVWFVHTTRTFTGPRALVRRRIRLNDDYMNTAPEPSTEFLATHQCLDLLRRSPVGRLAVVVGDRPQIFPVNHIVDQGTVVFRTASGTKLAGATGRLVAYEVDGHDLVGGSAWSVVVHGRAEQIRALHETVEALHLPLHPWPAGSKPHFVRIVPDEITGRRFAVTDRSTHPHDRSSGDGIVGHLVAGQPGEEA